jgi:hypothetical protein
MRSQADIHHLFFITQTCILFYLSSLAVFMGIEFSRHAVVPRRGPPRDGIAAIVRMDAANYQSIVENGYRYAVEHRSMVAFFPLFPALSWLMAWLGSFHSDTALLVVANSFLALSLFVLSLFSYRPNPELVWKETQWSLVLFCLMPAGFFLRMGYAESMLVFFAALALLGMQRGWPLWVLAVIAGLASGTRPVGIAVSAAVWWYYVFDRERTPHPLPQGERGQETPSGSPFVRGRKWLHLLWIMPLSCWGLLAYMAYLWWAFDAPLAFAQTQQHWTFYAPVQGSFSDKVWSLITLEPIWNVYNPDSIRFWARGDSQGNPLFSCLFWNPIFYLFCWFLIILGWCKRWLTGPEIVLSLGLLLIPYVTRAYEMSMASHARFAAVVIPQYFVLGRLFAMLPPAVAGCICGLMGLMLGLWTALFAAGYAFF